MNSITVKKYTSRTFVYDYSGLNFSLGSASKNAILILDKTDIRHFFDVIVGGNVVQASKPNPEVFLKGASLLNVESEECLVFEDAIAGVEAALAARMKVIGVGHEVLLNNANLVIASLAEMTVEQIKVL